MHNVLQQRKFFGCLSVVIQIERNTYFLFNNGEKKLSYFLRGSRNALSLTLNKILCRIPCDSNYWRKSTWKPNRHKLLSHYYIVQIVFFVRYNLQGGNNREIKSRDVSRFLWNIYDEASCQKSHIIDIWCGRKHMS